MPFPMKYRGLLVAVLLGVGLTGCALPPPAVISDIGEDKVVVFAEVDPFASPSVVSAETIYLKAAEACELYGRKAVAVGTSNVDKEETFCTAWTNGACVNTYTYKTTDGFKSLFACVPNDEVE